MKRIVSTVIAVLVAAGAAIAAAGLPAHAQEPVLMTDDHIARIKANCVTATATLGQVHANDALVYVNRNQTYFSISDKLIARLNSRLALNRFNTTPLAEVANEYNLALASFRAAYKQYDDTMTDLLKINCVRQPVGFYDKVGEAREQREKVQAAVKKLHSSIDQYRQAVESFKSQHSKQLGVDNE